MGRVNADLEKENKNYPFTLIFYFISLPQNMNAIIFRTNE